MSVDVATVRPLGQGVVGLWVHYDDRHYAKAIPSSRWDPELKCWRIAAMFADEARRVADRLNGIDDAGAPAALVELFGKLFDALPAPTRKPVHRALARVLHPDVGGDAGAMKALNAAAERRN